MAVKHFLDTNILLYAYDLDVPEKRVIAGSILERALIEPGIAAISVQVLQEFHVNFVRRKHSLEEATALLEDFCHWRVIENTLPIFRSGLSLQARCQVSLWDAMILAAAMASGATELLTEDLNHGQVYGSVRVINPFK